MRDTANIVFIGIHQQNFKGMVRMDRHDRLHNDIS